MVDEFDGLDDSFNDVTIKVSEFDRSDKAKKKYLNIVLNWKLGKGMHIKQFERAVHRLFDAVFTGFWIDYSFDRCLECLGVDDEDFIMPDFSKYSFHDLLWLLDSLCHIDRFNGYELMPYLIKGKYIENLVLELEKVKEHLLDEIDEDFLEKGFKHGRTKNY